MRKNREVLRDLLLTAGILLASFLLMLAVQRLFESRTTAPMIFVLAVFLVALSTHGYAWGIAASLVGVLAVNFAFAFPYFAFNFSIPENLFSAVVMLTVAVFTSALTTKVKRQEKARADSEKEKLRADLLRAISHDLRTPLTSIYGSCSAVIENYDRLKREQQLKLLGEVREDAEWLIRMVENLLSITRIDGSNVELITTPTVLEELIDSVLVRFQKRYPAQPVEVAIPEGFISIPMDALLIEQVLINLLENAVEHARGMTRLTLRVTTAGRYATFEVADNGCGIPRDKLGGIFTGYFGERRTAGDSSKHNMGIGLSVCAAIVRAHGGEIQAENRAGGGAIFRFRLKMEASELEQQQI